MSTRMATRRRLDRDLEHELALVHRLELARVLRDAVEIRLADEGRDLRLFGSPRAPTLDAWRRDAVQVLALAVLDRIELVPGTAVAHWLVREPFEWPTAENLATESLLLEDCDEGRLALGMAQLGARRPLEAVSTLVEARRRGVSPPNRWRVLAALASASEQSGAERLALEALSLALREPACAVGPRCATLVLALLHEREDLARRAARSLEVPRVASRNSAVVRLELGDFLDARGEPRPFAPRTPRLRALFEEWTRHRSLLGDVCRSLDREVGRSEDPL